MDELCLSYGHLLFLSSLPVILTASLTSILTVQEISPIFDKPEAELAKALMSFPATEGFEIGSGFPGTIIIGSEHNEEVHDGGPVFLFSIGSRREHLAVLVEQSTLQL